MCMQTERQVHVYKKNREAGASVCRQRGRCMCMQTERQVQVSADREAGASVSR